jgi:hypothetical protein
MAEINYLERGTRRVAGAPTALTYTFGLIGFVTVAALLLGGIYLSLKSPAAQVVMLTSVVTPSPEVNSGQALKQLRATEDAILSSYGWVDRQKGIVRIPIDRAIDLVLQRGLPARQGILEF